MGRVFLLGSVAVAGALPLGTFITTSEMPTTYERVYI